MRLAPNLLAINPGSSSTKFALYRDAEQLVVRNLQHSQAELARCGHDVLAQLQMRLALVEDELEVCGMRLDGIAAVVARGGLLHPVQGGTYRVNETMLEELRRAERGEHAANLGAFLAQAIASRIGVAAYIVDPVSVDEWIEVAHLSGCARLVRPCLSHALNSKAIARRYATESARRYEDLRLVVAHLGSGHTISAHSSGRMIDATNSREEGAFSTERAGSVPAMELVRLCYSGRYSQKEMETMLTREGGLISYLGTADLREVEARIVQGDQHAALVWSAMVYQIAKEIGAMACALCGRVDAILLTGGMAHSQRLTVAVSEAAGWIAPVKVYAGEDELRALAEGALRVIRDEEKCHEFGADVPEEMADLNALP
jgi:butyrate kinase